MYKDDTICRICASEEESLEHALNCGQNEMLSLDISKIGTISESMLANLIRAANRIMLFKELCDEEKTQAVATSQQSSNCSAVSDVG